MNATLAYTGLKVDRPAYTHLQDNMQPEFLTMFPHGKIPAFRSTSGFSLFEGAAIARYCGYQIRFIGRSINLL